MATKMFRDGARKITRDESLVVLKFLDALMPGMMYVKCGECHKFKQAIGFPTRTIPHPTEPNTKLLLYICEECK